MTSARPPGVPQHGRYFRRHFLQKNAALFSSASEWTITRGWQKRADPLTFYLLFILGLV